MSADLHLHSIYSDGYYSPGDLVDMACEKGIDTIALSDHDTVEGIDEIVGAGKLKGIDIIPAIEFSTFQGKSEIHILGYYIDYKSEGFLSRIEELFNLRLDRAKKMVKKLNRMGVDISYQDVQEIAGDRYIGRPHLARAMLKAGYIKSVEEAFSDKYIGNGGRAYVSKQNLKPVGAIKIIQQAGGIAVLAHPYLVNKGDAFNHQQIQRLVSSGLEGIEVYHSKHDQKAVDYYLNVANDLGILVTGGSDFHGYNHYGIELGDVILPDEYVLELKDYYQKKF